MNNCCIFSLEWE